MNWDRIPGLYTRTDKLLMVSITDAQWQKWGRPGGWTAWEPDTRAGNFIPNMAVVVCKGVFHDAQDPQLQNKVGHFMTIARVPDCVELLPFDQLREAFNSYNEAATAVGLVQLHRSNMVFPDVYFQFYSEHFTIMGLLDPEIWFGTADEFVGGYLVHRHIASSGQKAHTMLPPSYMQGATCPRPSPMYTYRPGGTGTPGQHPPIHVIFMAATGKVVPSPSRFCLVEAPAKEWSFNDAPVPWILPASYLNPNETVPDFDDNEAGSLGRESGPVPSTGAGAEVTAADGAEEEDDGFEMVDDGDEEPVDKVVIMISAKEVAKPEGSGLGEKSPMFESEEDDDPEIKKWIEAALDETLLLGDLMLSEHKDESDSESPDDDNDDDLDETKRYYEDQEEGTEGPGSKPSGAKAVNTGPAAIPENAGNPTSPRPDVPSGNTQPIKPGATKGKGPNNESSGKAPASKMQFSAVALGVQERAQSTLFGAATLAQATSTEEDTVRHLENYTGLLTGLQKLVVTMASGYEAATEDIRSLVASTLDVVTQRECTFIVVGASLALADWTAKYQHAMSQGANQSMPDQLARWDWVREAGIALSRHITTLTTEHEQSTVSGEIFRTLILACFQRIRVRTEATFSEVNATLPSLLCRFVAPDQVGQIMASIFTCLCNYNTEICGMAMAQTVVPVYTIPNTYRVQQSLWESLCWIIPGIARTSESELHSFEPTTPRNVPAGHSDMVPSSGKSGGLGTGTVGLGNPPNVAVSLPTCEKDVTQGIHSASLPDGIPPAGSKWVLFPPHVPTINLANGGNPPDANPPETSTPIKATPESGKCHSKKRLNLSKIEVIHLIFNMWDRQ